MVSFAGIYFQGMQNENNFVNLHITCVILYFDAAYGLQSICLVKKHL
jgi:hypothetical protein